MNLVPKNHLPRHVGIIMDGNGRWAKKRGLPRQAGHIKGAKTFKDISLYCADRGIEMLTVYAFSTENWKRPKAEIDAIMNLFRDYLIDGINNYKDKNVRLKIIGDKSVFPQDIKDLINEIELSFKTNTGMVLNIAMNYGGRDEIIYAVKDIADDILKGNLQIDDINENLISQRIYTPLIPDADLIIRPSGEYRLSNFLMWQSAYSEFWFSDILWPDFSSKDLEDAFNAFARRNRRFGGV